MRWDDELHGRLEMALNESTVQGLRLVDDTNVVDVLLDVHALPRTGPVDPDRRRVLRCRGTSEVRVLLRPDQPDDNTTVLELADFGAVEEFFKRVSLPGSMYGWEFIDDPALTDHWPESPSLTLALGTHEANHTFFWFNECLCGSGDDTLSYCIEGTVSFDELEVLRADGTPVALPTFIDDGVRWWDGLRSGDERLNTDAQRAIEQHGVGWRSSSRGMYVV